MPTVSAERWTHAFQAVMERSLKGDVPLPTLGARTGALRYCALDCPVQFLPTGNTVRVFAGGVRERR